MGRKPKAVHEDTREDDEPFAMENRVYHSRQRLSMRQGQEQERRIRRHAERVFG